MRSKQFDKRPGKKKLSKPQDRAPKARDSTRGRSAAASSKDSRGDRRPHRPADRDKSVRLEKPEKLPDLPSNHVLASFATQAEALLQIDQLKEESAKLGTQGQLSILLREEREDFSPELLCLGRVYAGAAWTLIHERRQAEQYYSQVLGGAT